MNLAIDQFTTAPLAFARFILNLPYDLANEIGMILLKKLMKIIAIVLVSFL